MSNLNLTSANVVLYLRSVGVILVDEDKALKAGITKGHVKTPQNVGGKYFANVEVFHQLHCLVCKTLYWPYSRLTCACYLPQNLLRKTSYWNYNYYQNLGEVEFENEERFLRIHAGRVACISECLSEVRH